MAPPALHIRLLGGFEVHRGGARLGIDAPRVVSLIAYLAMYGGTPQTRQRIAFLFWPESTEKQARTNLRNLLHQLRRAVPDVDEYLAVDARTLSWRPGARVTVDALDFQAAADRAQRASRAAAATALEEALRLYHGDLLPGWYDEWLIPEQSRLALLNVSVLERLIALRERDGQHDQVVDLAQRLLQHDPLREETHRQLIMAHVALADRARALRAYQECAAVLERELGVAPSAATRAAHQTALALGEPPSAETKRPDSMPFVGRRKEWSKLLELWRAVRGSHAHLALVGGEAGIGKTRLVEALSAHVARQGDAVAHARSFAAEGALAYAPIIEWLRSDVFRPVIARLDLLVRAELARLLPELATTEPAAAREMISEAERRRRIHDVVFHTLHALDRPVLLIADDLQWCDHETLELLLYVVRRSGGPILIVGTARREEVDRDHPLHDVAAGLTAIDRFTEIELPRFDTAQTAELAAHCARRPLESGEAMALQRETDGNPLFVIETLRMGWSATDASQDDRSHAMRRLPPKVQAVIETRLRQLSPEARQLAELAATIGRVFTPELLASARDSDDSVVPILDELWSRRIIREVTGEQYDFSHDRIREVAYLNMSPLRRREHHQRVARALESAHAGDPDSVAGQLAWHYDRGGATDQAIAWYARAADEAHRVSATGSVARLLRRALELLRRLPESSARDEGELEICLGLGAALVALEGYAGKETVEMYSAARGLCERLGRPVTAPILRALALGSIARSELETVESIGAQLARAAERDGDDVVAVEAQYVLGVASFWRGRLHDARRHLEAAIAAYHPERQREHVALYAQDPNVICLTRLAYTLWHLGLPVSAVSKREQALALARQLGHPLTHAYALWWAVFIAIEAEDTPAVREFASAMGRIAYEHRLVYIAAVVESFLGYADTLEGRHAAGVARMEAALTDSRAAGQESVLRPQTFTLLARAHATCSAVEPGLNAAAAGLEYAARGAYVWQSDLLRLRARLLIAAGADEETIAASFTSTLDTARAHGSAWMELLAAVDLVRWRSRGPAERHARSTQILEDALRRCGEHADVPAFREATKLLALSRRSSA